MLEILTDLNKKWKWSSEKHTSQNVVVFIQNDKVAIKFFGVSWLSYINREEQNN